MNADVMRWAAFMGAGIQWFKALPMKGQWATYQPVIAGALMVLAGYVCEVLSWAGPFDWQKFLSGPWMYVAIVAGTTQATSLAATFGVKAVKLSPDHPLVPVTNTK